MNFEDIKILCTDVEESKKSDRGDLFDVVIKLSTSAPENWSYYFNEAWQSESYNPKCHAIASEEHITISCILSELESIHLPQIEKIINKTNTAYRDFLFKKTKNKGSSKESWEAELKPFLNELNKRLFKKK